MKWGCGVAFGEWDWRLAKGDQKKLKKIKLGLREVEGRAGAGDPWAEEPGGLKHKRRYKDSSWTRAALVPPNPLS